MTLDTQTTELWDTCDKQDHKLDSLLFAILTMLDPNYTLSCFSTLLVCWVGDLIVDRGQPVVGYYMATVILDESFLKKPLKPTFFSDARKHSNPLFPATNWFSTVLFPSNK